jgi:hypothetical protein
MDGGPLIATLLFAAIFMFGARLRGTARAAISIGAGISTAYVFVRLLPELSEASEVFVDETSGRGLPRADLRVYVSALVGFILFYGLQHLVKQSRKRDTDQSMRVFFPVIAGFAAYAWLVCCLMTHGFTARPTRLGLYSVAMGLHFLGIGHALVREHPGPYNRFGRALLAAASIAGWATASFVSIPHAALITGFGLISGGVVMNSMITELPGEEGGRFWLFAAGAVGYALVLILVR